MSIYHVAACLNETCGESARWLDARDRDKWAVRHEEATGHEVGVRTEHVGAELPVAQSALVIRAGDRVLLTVGPGHTEAECLALRNRLRVVYPGVKPSVAAGVTAVVKVEGTS